MCSPLHHTFQLTAARSRLSHGRNAARLKTTDLPLLRDLDQPFVYDIRMYNRAYRFEFSDTASPENYTLLHPNFVILCYDINDRRSLVNVQQVWRKDVIRHYSVEDESIPVMLLGLKRDLREEGADMIDPQEVSALLTCSHTGSGKLTVAKGLSSCSRDAV